MSVVHMKYICDKFINQRILTDFPIEICLTLDGELSSRLAVFGLACVFAAITLLYVVDDQFSATAVLIHLIFLSRFEDDPAFPPLHRISRLGELTAEMPIVPFLHHQTLELLFECHWKCC